MGSGAMAGVVTRSYKAGSVVYFEGDKSEYIYILKSGRILLTYIRPETGEEIKEDIKQGEFFGVKSSLGKYPREETAQTLSDTIVLQLRLDDFERIVLGNVQVVKKMLRVFSNQLRRVGRAQREVLGETNTVNPSAELFKIGEYYFRNGRADQALYAYKKYLEYYPNTQFSQTCMQRVNDIKSGNFTAAPEEEIPLSAPAAPSSAMSGFDADAGSGFDDSSNSFAPASDGPGDMVDFDIDGSSSPSAGMHTELSSEMDDFLNGSGDGFSLPTAAPTIRDIMNNAKAAMSSGDFASAAETLSGVIDDASPSDPAERDLWEEAHFQLGAAYYGMGKLKEAMNEFSMFMKNYPQSKYVKNTLVYTGYVFEKAGAKDKAVPYYKKAATMPPKDDMTAAAMSRLKALG
ncbi:MAG: cyclic nucleotide-binding domain-containing protein [Spirochaetota bacterium]